jgi:hypothetical protein
MVVNFEFLSDEPIENVITCMRFKVDKVVFLGFYDTIVKRKDSTKNFLKKYCGVNEVIFLPLSERKLPSILEGMKKAIDQEKSHGTRIFFDITGGEDLLLVAFGMLAKEYSLPIHFYDVAEDKLVELDEGAKDNISVDAPQRKVELNLDSYAEMMGVKLNYHLQKEAKADHGPEFAADSEKIFRIAKEYDQYWNAFCYFVTKTMSASEDLWVNASDEIVIEELSKRGGLFNNTGILDEILDVLSEEGLILGLEHGSRYRFRFKNEVVKSCIAETGSPLEFHVFYQNKEVYDDCRIGIHIDWDGEIHDQDDVFNEIDVLCLNGIIPTFISCKSGNMTAPEKLGALYELETVARRLGGKYAKKRLMTTREFGSLYEERAKNMGIEVAVAE